MPAGAGLSVALERHLRAHRGPLPAVEHVDQPATDTVQDTYAAVDAMRAAGARGLAVLGGDGTHRAVAKRCGDLPLLALSTGTNNAFPAVREATVAGLALGLVATGRLEAEEATRPERALRVEDAAGRARDLALVDVAVSRSRVVGARALWRAGDVSELLVAFAEPDAIGLSAVAAALGAEGRGGASGLRVRLVHAEEADLVVDVPLAPGLIVRMGVAGHEPLRPGEAATLAPGPGALALDGERELERDPCEELRVRLVDGPRTVDVRAALRLAGERRLLATSSQPARP
jgi:hypothetical protein